MPRPKGKRVQSPFRNADQRGRIFPEPERVPITGTGLPARVVLYAPRGTILDAKGNLRLLPGDPERRSKFIEAVTRKLEGQKAAEARANAARAKPRLPHTITDRQLWRILEVLGYTRSADREGLVFTCSGKPIIRIASNKATREISLRTTSMRWVAPFVREFFEKGHTL